MQPPKPLLAILAFFALITVGLGLAMPTIHQVKQYLGLKEAEVSRRGPVVHQLGPRDVSCEILPNTCQLFSLAYPDNMNFVLSMDPNCKVWDKVKNWGPGDTDLNNGRGTLVTLKSLQMNSYWYRDPTETPMVEYKGFTYGWGGADAHQYYCEPGQNDDAGDYCMIYYPC